MKKKFYITTAIPYVNAPPHIGHALEFVQADALARYHQQMGYDVCLLSGGDENALKNVQAAEKAGVPVRKFIDTNTALFQNLANKLNIRFDRFQKGSDREKHYPASQKLWQMCAHDIYKKSYTGLYCVGCEAFYTKDELNENGECPEHPSKILETVSEENYFFRLSSYQQKLIDLISSDTLKIIPSNRKNEILSFLTQPLQDISISRSNERAKNWGVPVPGDDTQRMYVWFDALNIYQSGIGFGWDEKEYDRWWPADMHVIGKGISRFHAVYWPAFLLSSELKIPKTIFIHEYFTVNGQKMSKTLGNVIDPIGLIEKYGVDPVRYYLLAKFSPFHDGNYSEDEFKKTYNADLANGLGNLVARTAKMALGFTFTPQNSHTLLFSNFEKTCEFDKAIASIFETVKSCDVFINTKKVWTLEKKEKQNALEKLVSDINNIAHSLLPFIPETAHTILDQFHGPEIKISPPLFPRI